MLGLRPYLVEFYYISVKRGRKAADIFAHLLPSLCTEQAVAIFNLRFHNVSAMLPDFRLD